MSRSDKRLLAELIGIFDQVRRVPFKRYQPDDWRGGQPTSFNCSSFVQWLGLCCLGWGDRILRIRGGLIHPIAASALPVRPNATERSEG